MNNPNVCCGKCRICPDYPNSEKGHGYCHDVACPCHTPEPNTASWEKSFDEKFGETDVYPNDLIPKNDVLAIRQHIKSFIHSVEASAFRRGAERACEYINTNLMWGRNQRGELCIESAHIAEVLEQAREVGDEQGLQDKIKDILEK